MAEHHVRQPAVAGTFYPGDARALDAAVKRYLAEARGSGAGQRTNLAAGTRQGSSANSDAQPDAQPDNQPKAIIVPHAGFVYSGPIAASAYAQLGAIADQISRVVLLGPSHRVYLEGLAATSADAFCTPLGQIPIDRVAVERALALPQVVLLDSAHAREHSLEVQLPFLQCVLGDFALAPFSVGDATADAVCELLELLWGGDETLIVISSDLSHYYDYQTARRLDAATTRAIESLQPEGLDSESACGRVPIRGLLQAARRHGLRARALDVRSSGDTAGTRAEVVGYGSYLFS